MQFDRHFYVIESSTKLLLDMWRSKTRVVWYSVANEAQASQLVFLMERLWFKEKVLPLLRWAATSKVSLILNLYSFSLFLLYRILPCSSGWPHLKLKVILLSQSPKCCDSRQVSQFLAWTFLILMYMHIYIYTHMFLWSFLYFNDSISSTYYRVKSTYPNLLLAFGFSKQFLCI